MRFAGTVAIAAVSVALVASGLWTVQAQTDTPIRLAEKKKKAVPKAKTPAKKKGEAKAQPTPSAYAGMTAAERAGIQFDLNWTNHFTGQADGEFTDRSVTAVKAFQKDRGFRETGVLAANEREALAMSAKNRRERVGWRMVEDRATGAYVGLPGKLATRESRARRGTLWQSAQGQLQIETFRIREPGATLATVFEDQKKEPPGRQLASSALRNGYFVLTGMQGLKRFLVRAEVRDLEIRGIAVLYDQAIENTTDYVGLAVLSTFAPFPGTGVMALIGPPARSRIEYGTGIVVTAAGHVLTDRQVTEGCNVLQIAGHGDASRIAELDNITLLRVFGASSLTAAALVHEGTRGAELTLVGIADPQTQGGGRIPSTMTARLSGEGLDPAPRLGFAGAAAIDNQGFVAGMVTLKSPVLAGSESTAPPLATIAPIATIRDFLDAHFVMPATGPAGVDAAKTSVVRVICVRR